MATATVRCPRQKSLIAFNTLWIQKLGVMKGLGCRFAYKGRPLAGATITFEPEPFMADYIQPAVGETDVAGACSLNRQNDPLGGITVGFYKRRVSRPYRSGKETMPEKYNTETTLGQEIVTGAMGLVLRVRITS